ncbi:uncharacterized protein MONOS_2975 [Monocercomonoides exilis]|uniref:uncharacterized protein n=1 Tax=Monocercomonoides exilis TaxID=2049356 RepID=UPI0035594538|nr:hypothetical protein MONOS_2975 [Monocercomonoides exilis]|eukprot:MONOS_2975.1-p1 / transcript=MONOS_2975.1 / gene=MONOS_2975 / organism=Monocercomonoides_exilis_PA203 / gene_product=unspecified product / transcript_product=unspecified product / location=Mono_scaffold00065:141118-141887(-) / protein_length=204 / sequence_SO=supercontig / SO=protein_coding / is_pseudo=false
MLCLRLQRWRSKNEKIQRKWQWAVWGRECCVEEKRDGLGKGVEKGEGRCRLVDVKVGRKRKKGGGEGVVPVVVAECEGVCGGEDWRRELRCVYSEECGAWQPLSGSRGCLWEEAAWRMGGTEAGRGRDGGDGGDGEVLDEADADVARAEELEREILGLLQAGACRGRKEAEENAAVLVHVRVLQSQLEQDGRKFSCTGAFHLG